MKSLYSATPQKGTAYGVVQASNTENNTFLQGVVTNWGIKWAHDYENLDRLVVDGFQVMGDAGVPKLGPSSSTPAEYAADVKAKMLASSGGSDAGRLT
jgi:hypothetical protein